MAVKIMTKPKKFIISPQPNINEQVRLWKAKGYEVIVITQREYFNSSSRLEQLYYGS